MKHNLETVPSHDFGDITKEEKPPFDEDDFSDVENERQQERAEKSDHEGSDAGEMPRVVPPVPEPRESPVPGSEAVVPLDGDMLQEEVARIFGEEPVQEQKRGGRNPQMRRQALHNFPS